MARATVRKIRVMVSSTRTDLQEYRDAALRIIKKVAEEKEEQIHLIEVSMEKETSSGNRELPLAVSRRWVEESDWFVIIVGFNYGTIPDDEGADRLSITEWEYKRAVELGKDKVFVFIAGNPGTVDQYRYATGEQEDLKDWKDTQTEEQAEKLKRFKQNLQGPHVAMFKNVAHFCARLERTLQNAIDDLPPEISPGTPLANLIVEMAPNIRDCTRRVKVIEDCKRVHDHLHELLQNVTLPLREEVLSKWMEDMALSMPADRVISFMIKASRQLGGIAEVIKGIGPEHSVLRGSAEKVLEESSLWDPNAPPTVGQFAEALDKFADAIQDAFSEADRSMSDEEADLRERYLALLEGLKRAREQHDRLSRDDDKRLEDELQKVDSTRSRVKNCLTTHHRWQEAHDKLHDVDSFRETNLFDRQLNVYRGTGLVKLLDLVDKELDYACAHLSRSADALTSTTATAVLQQDPLDSSQNSHQSSAFADDVRRLRTSLEILRIGGGGVPFDNMRRRFDNVFYCVDKRTLEEISRAGKRVAALDEWLDGLATASRKRH